MRITALQRGRAHAFSTLACLRHGLALALSAALLSGCVTMQGPSGPKASSETKPLDLNVSGLTDMFSTQMREIKALVSASKFDEAEQYFFDNAEYFDKRFPAGTPLTSELATLAAHVWKTRYEAKAQGYLQQLTPLAALPPATEWGSLNKTLADTLSLAEVLDKHRLLRLSGIGQAEVNDLRAQQKRVLALAHMQKPTVVRAMVDSTLETGNHSSQYIGGASIEPSDFQASEPFQAAAVAKVKQQGTRQAVAAEAKRLADYLSQSSKTAVDEYYGELVRKELLADGRVTLEEIAGLREFSAPFKTDAASLKNIARVGYLDLTGASFKDRNIFDFQISFVKDIGIEFAPATEDTFNTANLSNYDFVFVTDLTAAKVSREFKKKEGVKSRYKSGTRQAPNPNYVTAMTQYQTAMAEFQRAQINSAVPKACQGWGCVLQGLADGLGSAAARSKVEQASSALAGTPQTLSIDVFSEYEFQSVDISSNKSATVNYYVIDVKGNRILQNDFSIQDHERFSVAYNVRDDDPDSSGISRRFKSEDEVTAWEKRAVSIPLSSLFSPQGFKSASSQPFKGVQAFLRNLSTRTYAAASPKYVSAASTPSLGQSSRSGDTIADERFDSIVIVRNAQATGTGFYVTPDLVLTAHHVVEGSALVELTFYDGTKSYGKVVDHDARLDLALIRAQTAGKPLKIHTGPIRLGETVEAIGHPKGYEFTITRGVISAVRKQRSAALSSGNLVEFVQTDTPISNGNSGGPLMLKDAVIGVNDWIRVDKGSQNLNFSVSYNEIRSYLERFKGR